MMKVYIYDPNCKVVLFGFNRTTKTFIIESVKLGNYETESVHRNHKPTTHYVHDIKSYEFVKPDSIILHGFNNDTYIYNEMNHRFEVYYNIQHKLYISSKICVEHNNVLWNTNCIGKPNNRTLEVKDMMMCIPENIVYVYNSFFNNILVTLKDGKLMSGYSVIHADMANYITSVTANRRAFLIFNNDVPSAALRLCASALKIETSLLLTTSNSIHECFDILERCSW